MLAVTRENAAVLFLDLQEEIVKYSRTQGVERLRRCAGALAKLAQLHALPSFASAVPTGGAYLAEIRDVLDPGVRMRTHTTAFADQGLVEALRATGRPALVLAGVASEIVVLRTALDALAAGYAVQIAVDACGGISERSEEAAWRRMLALGGITTSVTSFAAELAGDFATPAGAATLAIMYETFSA